MDHQVQIEIYKFESYPPTHTDRQTDRTCLNNFTDKNKLIDIDDNACMNA
jgi:hypothetical protein